MEEEAEEERLSWWLAVKLLSRQAAMGPDWRHRCHWLPFMHGEVPCKTKGLRRQHMENCLSSMSYCSVLAAVLS